MGWKSVKEKYKIDYMVAVYPGEGICIGSHYVHDIVRINFEGRITKVFDSWSNQELSKIITDMKADEATGELKRLVQMPDTFSGELLPIYTSENGRILKKWCEVYGWPNVTTDGSLMYENTYFKDKERAVRSCKENAKAGLKIHYRLFKEMIRDNNKNFKRKTARLISELYYYILSLFV